MDVFKLDPATFQPSTSVKNIQSVAWTERYQEAGDFQLVVEDDISIISALPLGCCISHNDTTEVMIVENHEIDRDENKKLKVTVTGRSFETFLENRTTAGTLQNLVDGSGNSINEVYAATSPIDVANYLVFNAIDATTAVTNDAIVHVFVNSDMHGSFSPGDYVVKRGDVYARVMELLQLTNTGIRNSRPYNATTDLTVAIHDGQDLTADVFFQAQLEDLLNAKYFWSIKGYKNYDQIDAKIFNHEYRTTDLGSDVTGMARRVMYSEASDLEGAYVFGSTDDPVEARAQIDMAKYRELSLMQATISETAKPKFKINYDVGDLVTVYAEFGIIGTMRVTEHILTKDETGVHGYPSLSLA